MLTMEFSYHLILFLNCSPSPFSLLERWSMCAARRRDSELNPYCWFWYSMDFDHLGECSLLEWAARGVDERTYSLANNFAAAASSRYDFVRLTFLACNFKQLAAVFPVDQCCLMNPARSLPLLFTLSSGKPFFCVSSMLTDVIRID